MNADKKVLYTVSTLLVLALLPAMFIAKAYILFIAAALSAAAAVVIAVKVKKRSILSIEKQQVTLIMAVIAAVYLTLYYLTGTKFGFTWFIYRFSLANFAKFILPITIIIVAIEVIRSVLLAQKSKAVDVLAYIACVATEIIINMGVTGRMTHGKLMDIVAMTLFPAITANLLYHYLSRRHGMYPNIAFRLITTLYAYVIPVYPSTPDALVALAKMLIPLIIYLFISALYEKKRKYAVKQNKGKWRYVTAGALVVIMISIVMLISCQFRYATLVIATESMTGEINKGDAVVYEQYDEQIVKEGDVVVFNKDGKRIVHRVVDIQRIDGRNRYFTKGDANDSWDSGYITEANIEGVVLFKVSYIGYPTILIRDIFK